MVKKIAGTSPSKSIHFATSLRYQQRYFLLVMLSEVFTYRVTVKYFVKKPRGMRLQFIIYLGGYKKTITMHLYFVCECIHPFLLKPITSLLGILRCFLKYDLLLLLEIIQISGSRNFTQNVLQNVELKHFLSKRMYLYIKQSVFVRVPANQRYAILYVSKRNR